LSSCIEKLPHSCGSSDALQVFKDGNKYSAYCFACDTYVPDPYKDKPANYKPTPIVRDFKEIIEELDQYGCVDLPERKLKKEFLEYFGIKVGLSEVDGCTPISHHYPYYSNGKLVRYKHRIISNKKIWCSGSSKDLELFGWKQALVVGGKTLYITEGELDAVALFQAFKETNRDPKYANYNPSVVSVPNGASSAAKELSRFQSEIRKNYKNIVLVFDMDEPGQKAVEEIVKIFPDAKVASLPAKDPNDCLIKGFKKGLVSACTYKANTPKNTRIIFGSSLKEQAKKKPEWGLSWPFKGLTDLTRGIRRGETYYFGAGVKLGKSELVNTIASHLITEHDLPVLMCKPEEAVSKTYQMLVGKAAGKIFHDPKIEFDEEAFDLAEPKIGNKAIILDSYQFVDWDTLKGDIIYVVKSEDVKDIFIDPITCFTNQMNSAEANEFLVGMSAELSSMAKDLSFTSYVFCHLKAPLSGDPHERGGEVFSNQFAGSRAMMRSSNYMIGLEGNKDPDLPIEQRNMRRLVVLEDREFGNTGVVNLYWNYKNGQFSEIVQ
jgi:twinkle protein